MRAMKDSGIEWIGKIPQDWQIAKVKHVYSFQTGWTPSTSNAAYFDGDLPWANISDIGKTKTIYDTAKHITEEAVANSSMGISPKGSLMYSFKLSVGDVSFCGTDMYTNEAIATFLPSDKYDLRYLYYAAPLFIIKNANENIYGAKLLNQELIRNALILNPPYNEQVSVADYLDAKCAEIDALIAAKEKTNALLKERRQSIIYEAVTKGLNPDAPMKDSGVEWIGEIPEHWERIALKYCIQQVGSGTSVNAEDRPANTDEMGVLKTSCVSSGCFAALENKAILENEYDRATCPVKADTVIVSRMNTPDLVGACGYVEEDHPHLYLPDRLWQVEFNKECVAKYMWYFLTSKYVRNYYASVCTGTSGSMQNISQDQFGAIAFFKPSKAEQQSIAEYLDRECETLLSLIDVNEQSLQKLKEYRQSIIYEAVTGKIEV